MILDYLGTFKVNHIENKSIWCIEKRGKIPVGFPRVNTDHKYSINDWYLCYASLLGTSVMERLYNR